MGSAADRLEDIELAQIVREREVKEAFRSALKTYDLSSCPSALTEWKKLGADIREQFARKLSER
jgi:hypothetical protein